MLIRKTTITTIAAVTAMGLAACGDSADEGTAPGGTQAIKYTAGAATVTDWDDYVAEERGLYKANGCTLDRIETQTAAAATQLLVTGEAKVGRGLPPAILAVNGSHGGVKLVSVADMLIRPPHVMVGKGIKDLAELKGKTVGTSSPNDSSTVVTEDMLRKKGLSRQTVDLVPSGGTADRLAALKSGAIAATLLLPPVNFTAVDDGLTDLGYLPDVMGKDWTFAFTSVIVNPDWAKNNRAAVECILKARDGALRWLNDPANKAEANAILAKATKVKPEVAARTYELLKIGTEGSAFAARAGVEQKAAKQVLDDLVTSGLVENNLKIEDLVDDSYAAAVRAGAP